jgi:hypothetical protein
MPQKKKKWAPTANGSPNRSAMAYSMEETKLRMAIQSLNKCASST